MIASAIFVIRPFFSKIVTRNCCTIAYVAAQKLRLIISLMFEIFLDQQLKLCLYIKSCHIATRWLQSISVINFFCLREK